MAGLVTWFQQYRASFSVTEDKTEWRDPNISSNWKGGNAAFDDVHGFLTPIDQNEMDFLPTA